MERKENEKEKTENRKENQKRKNHKRNAAENLRLTSHNANGMQINKFSFYFLGKFIQFSLLEIEFVDLTGVMFCSIIA